MRWRRGPRALIWMVFWQWIALFAIFIACFACFLAFITLAALRHRNRQDAMVADDSRHSDSKIPQSQPPPACHLLLLRLRGALNHFEPNEPSIGHLEPWYAVIGRPDQPHALYTAEASIKALRRHCHHSRHCRSQCCRMSLS